MKPHYSWQTDEDGEEPVDDAARLPRKAGASRHRMLILLIVAAVVLFAIMFQLFDRRVQANEDAVQQDVEAAFQTWRKAIEGRDFELFTSLLSRQDANWFMSQRRVFMAERTIDRAALGLRLAQGPSTIESVALDSSWREAELTFSQTYLPNDATPAQPEVTLLHTQLFRLQGDRWLQAQPDEDFWGDTRTEVTPHLELNYPARDEAIVIRLATDLDREIENICGQWLAVGNSAMPDCDKAKRTPLRFETDSEALFAFAGDSAPLMRGRSLVLPAPSLVGLPQDEVAYNALYQGYTSRIVAMIRNSLGQPIPFSDQDLAALCFPMEESRLALQLFDPQSASWEKIDTARNYWFLQSLPNADGLVLRGGAPGTNLAHLQLAKLDTNGETLLYEEGTTEQSALLLGVSERGDQQGLLLSSMQGSTGLTDYRYLPLGQCQDGSCPLTELPGFPVWSPDGRRSLVMRDGELYLSNREIVDILAIGRAFSPFWLTADTFGYVRLLGGARNERPDLEVVVQSAAGGAPVALFRTAAVRQALGLADDENARILYVAPSPADPKVLFLAASSANRGVSRFDVLMARIAGSIDPLSGRPEAIEMKVVQSLARRPVGDRSVLMPTGYAPFMITGDGRWLMSVTFDSPITNTWRIHLYDIATAEAKTLSMNYPAYPALFPYYDWSDDWQWLAIVDNGIMRLAAPAFDYERVVAHDFDACRYVSWVSPNWLTR